MKTLRLVAKRPFKFQGRMMAIGDVFTASIAEAVALQYRGQAKFAPVKATVTQPAPAVTTTASEIPIFIPVPDPPQSESELPAPTWDIRDNHSESNDGGESTGIAIEAPRPKRKYRRRDMEAESPTDET